MNRRVSAITPSITLGITAKAKELAAAGRTIFSFAAGEPDFDTPEHIKAAAVEALGKGLTKYTPTAGALELRKAIAAKLENENGIKTPPAQVVVSCGAKHSLFNLVLALCDEGDEVILPAPYWLSYPEMMRVAGADSVVVQCSQENDFKMTPDEFAAAITPRTRAVIINSPSNPIGGVYSEEELRAIAEVALKHRIYVISDEIYEKMTYDGCRHFSIASISDEMAALTITVNGFSKAYSMTGWRLGYLTGAREIVDAVDALQSHSTSGPTTFAQFAAIAALTGTQAPLQEMVAAFDERRNYMYERLTSIAGVTCVRPQGAFYMLPDIGEAGMDSVTFSEKLITDTGVAVVPGAAFGNDRTVRLSYACSMQNIENGLDRLESFIKAL